MRRVFSLGTLALCGVSVGCGSLFIDELVGQPEDVGLRDAADALDGGADAGNDGRVDQAVESDAGIDAGAPGLVDRGLLVRYFMDEARVLDQRLSSDGRMPLSPRATDASEQVELPTGRAVRFLEVSGDNGYCGSSPSLLISELDGFTGSIEAVASLDEGSGPLSRIVDTGARERWSFSIGIDGSADRGDLELFFIMNESESPMGQWPLPDGERHVYTVTVDSRAANPEERVRLYIDGAPGPANEALVLDEGGDSLPQDTRIELADDVRTCIGNRFIGDMTSGARTPRGTIGYAAYYNSALTSDEVAANARRLLANDDRLET